MTEPRDDPATPAQALDYASVVMKINQIDEKVEMVGQVNMADFLARAKHNRDIALRYARTPSS